MCEGWFSTGDSSMIVFRRVVDGVDGYAEDFRRFEETWLAWMYCISKG
jgi:hypothetical protein